VITGMGGNGDDFSGEGWGWNENWMRRGLE